MTEPRGAAPRWLVIGGTGMLGTDLVARLESAGAQVSAVGSAALDITDLDAVLAQVAGHDVVVNCAAFTAVDAAEAAEAQAFAINATGAAHVARAAAAHGARLVHVSTDYVLPGDATTPYAEDAPVGPRSAYGRTKAAGEWAVLAQAPDAIVLRVAWLYGAHGKNFAATMARLAGERDEVSVVADQFGQPTWTRDVAQRILTLIRADVAGGIWHGTSSGQTSWAGFAQAVFTSLGLDPARVRAITTAEFPVPAPRPAYSVLGHQRWLDAGLTPPGDWAQSWAQAAPSVLGLGADEPVEGSR